MEGSLNVDFTQYKTNVAAAPGITEFVAKYKAKYGTDPRSGHSLANYVGAKIFFDAMQASKDLSASALRESVMKVDVPVGATASGWGAKFNEAGQNTRVSPFIMQWQAGELVTVFPANAAVAKMKTGLGSN
jgi:branched-chain amino acid transport system substrate-binding protein